MSTTELESQEVQTTTDSTAAETCPRCHTTQPWGQASWCPCCGYYPAVDGAAAGGASWADALPEVPQEEEADDRTAMESIPVWFWAMIGGIAGITFFSVGVRMSFPEDEATRGAIALAQLCTGLGSMLISHLISAKLAFASDRRLNATDILLSWLSVWQPTLDRLPQTCKRVWAMVWGMAAVLTAVTIIGGIDYGAPFRTHKAPDISPMNVVGTVAAAAASQAKAQGNKNASLSEAMGELQSQVAQASGPGGLPAGDPNMSMEDSLRELGNMEEQMQQMSGALDAAADLALNGGLTEEEIEKAKTSTLDCYIYGVVTDSKNIPTGFLFAANTRGTDQHVAEIAAEDLPKTAFRKIAVRLYKEVRKTPEIESDRKAIWVKPVVSCRIQFKRFLENGELAEAKFESILVNQRGVMNPEKTRTQRSAVSGQRR